MRFFRAFLETSALPLHLTLSCDGVQQAFWRDKLSDRIEQEAEVSWQILPEGLLPGGYYWPLRFQLRIQEEEPMDIVDGGFVDWTQRYLSDQKKRLLISAIGTEIFLKRYLTREW